MTPTSLNHNCLNSPYSGHVEWQQAPKIFPLAKEGVPSLKGKCFGTVYNSAVLYRCAPYSCVLNTRGGGVYKFLRFFRW